MERQKRQARGCRMEQQRRQGTATQQEQWPDEELSRKTSDSQARTMARQQQETQDKRSGQINIYNI